MKLPLSWLLEFAPLEASVHDISVALTNLGIEVEGIAYPAASIEGVVVGRIQHMRAHPNADRLRVLQVDVAQEEILSIVCGASNMQEGDHIALATVGTCLAGDFKIKRGKIRGESSLGMCCSEVELGLAEEADGILILDPSAPVGSAVSDYLGMEKAIFDLSITPNRGDCMSIYGLGRELAAYFDVPLADLSQEVTPSSITAPSVVIADGKDCALYHSCRIDGLNITDTPKALQARLQACGMRSVNGVVDIINYVMLELGQPMHAFDAASIEGNLHIRRAHKEEMQGLDERNFPLNDTHLVVADDHKILALAGVMGSLQSGVQQNTQAIVLESAVFDAARVSIAARQHGAVTEASMRFERGVDRSKTLLALQRASALIVTFFGGQASAVQTVEQTAANQHHIRFPVAAIAQRLGVEIPEHTDVVLQRMGFAVQRDTQQLHIDVPSHRHDVRIAEDVIEEYARIYGYDHIPTVLPRLTMQAVTRKPMTLLQYAISQGFTQVINYAFVSDKQQRLFSDKAEQDVQLQNPISAEMAVMRHSLFPGLLANAQYNMNRQQAQVCLVEEGRCYFRHHGKFQENNQLALLWTGEAKAERWYDKQKTVDFFDMKGVLETILTQLGQSPRWQACDDIQGLQAGQTAVWQQGKRRVATVAKVSQMIAKSFDLSGDVFVAEINLDMLSKPRKIQFKALPQHPSVTRDLVFLFAKEYQADAILATARKAAGKLAQDVRIFDRYAGKGIAEGFVSLGIRFILQAADRTLAQEEVDQIAAKAVQLLQKKFAAEQR